MQHTFGSESGGGGIGLAFELDTTADGSNPTPAPERPPAGTVVLVQNYAGGTLTPPSFTMNAGGHWSYVTDYDDTVLQIQVSTDNGTTWVGPIPSRESITVGINSASVAAQASADAAQASTDAAAAQTTATAAAAATASGQPGLRGEVNFDDAEWTGADDDATLASVMSYAGAQTHPPVIRLSNRQQGYAFSAGFTPYRGFRLSGPNHGISNSELVDASMGCKVNLSTNGAWLNVTGGDVWDTDVSGITFLGSSSTTFIGGDSTSVWHCSHLRDVAFHSFKTVLGTQAQKLLMTACLIDGWFQMQGMYNGGVHIGGSDNRVFMQGALADGSQAYNTAGNATGQPHFWFDGFDNSQVGQLYVTATGLWSGVLWTGVDYNTGVATNRGMSDMWGVTVEGQSASLPCYGSLLRVQGGLVKLHGGYIARGMSNPTAMGHTPTDAGIIHVTGGYLGVEWATYDRANGVAESVPFIYNNGGYVDVSHVSVATTGGTWTGLPQVHNASGTLIHDASVTQV